MCPEMYVSKAGPSHWETAFSGCDYSDNHPLGSNPIYKAVSPWASYVVDLSLNLLSSKMGVRVVLTLWGTERQREPYIHS